MRGMPEILFCRILTFMWCSRALLMTNTDLGVRLRREDVVVLGGLGLCAKNHSM